MSVFVLYVCFCVVSVAILRAAVLLRYPTLATTNPCHEMYMEYGIRSVFVIRNMTFSGVSAIVSPYANDQDENV